MRGGCPRECGGIAGESRGEGAPPRDSVYRFETRVGGARGNEKRQDVEEIDILPSEEWSGARGTRTPKGLRPPHFECGALPVRTSAPEVARAPPDLLTDEAKTQPGEGLCLDEVGTGGFEPPTPRSRSECST